MTLAGYGGSLGLFREAPKDIKQLGHIGTWRKYGVSDNAVRKWLKYYENSPDASS